MACNNRITIFKPGKGSIWHEKLKKYGTGQSVPCGQCSWCRFVRTRQWALRCYLERQTHKDAAFVTLTYAPEHLPKNGTLVRKHVQGFLKRLRSNIAYQYGENIKIRFYASGEYGEENSRPHYHILIFGFGFPDKKFHRHSHAHGFTNPVYRSEFLEKCWKFGFSELGSVTLESAAYTAGYIRKKINGALADEHYKGRQPEFSLQSTTPGIGADWYELNKHWLWNEDIIQCNGRSYRPPRAFEKYFQKEDPEGFAAFQERKKLRLPLTNINAHNQAEELPDEPEDTEDSKLWDSVIDGMPGIDD